MLGNRGHPPWPSPVSVKVHKVACIRGARCRPLLGKFVASSSWDARFVGVAM